LHRLSDRGCSLLDELDNEHQHIFTWRKSSAYYGSGSWKHLSLFGIRTSASTKRFSTASLELANGSTCTVGRGRLWVVRGRDVDRATASLLSSACRPSRRRTLAESRLGPAPCRRTNRATLPGVAAAEPRVDISRGWARIFVFLSVVGQPLCIVEQPLSVARATAQEPVSPTSIQTQPDAARFRHRSLLFRRCYRLLASAHASALSGRLWFCGESRGLGVPLFSRPLGRARY
jgi:hypothetical protein